jgi:plasmid stabilization system protein ParE
MIAQVRLTRRAAVDLREVVLANKLPNVNASATALQEFVSVFSRLLEGSAGMSCDEILPGYRVVPLEDYVIFYKQDVTGAPLIVRILRYRWI